MMETFIYLLISFPILFLQTTSYPFLEEKYPMVNLSNGLIRGLVSNTQNNNRYYSFRGIPYAKPPLGNLRFRPPQPVENWSETYDATKNAPHCLQKNYLFGKDVEGSEDCLYLNVYVPGADYHRRQSTKQFPVMIFIHWGGFFAGYSSSDFLGPEYLLDSNVIVVTFNYRLGVFGFLSTNDDASPGNYGLKDQNFVLKWVRENIDKFGGNPENVTIFGQSAGGASVHFHMLSPSSKGLFQRAISQSGTALSLWAQPAGPLALQVAIVQAKIVGCNKNTNDTNYLVNCLRSVDATQLVQSGDKFKFFSVDPLTVYLPSIEKKTIKNPEPFLTKEPIEYLLSGDFQSVPWILGSVEDEGIIRAAPLLSQSESREKFLKQFNDLMPKLIALFVSTPQDTVHNLWKKIKQYYFGDKDTIDLQNPDSIQGLVNLYTDRSFAYSLYQTVLIHLLKGRQNIWLYNFNYKGRHSYRRHFVKSHTGLKHNWGVSHCDELIYLFKSPALFPELESTNDRHMRKYLSLLWSNFARFGNPTHRLETYVDWPAMEPSEKLDKSLVYLNISGSENGLLEFSSSTGLFNDRLKFWEELPLAENIKDLDQTHIDL